MDELEKIKSELESLERRVFVLKMVDYWDAEDRENYDNYTKRINELRNKIKEFEK